MIRNILKYGYFILCVSVFFSVEQKWYTIKVETPLEWLIAIFNITLLLYAWRNRFSIPVHKPLFLSLIALCAGIIISVLDSQVLWHSVKGAIVWISYVFAFAGGFWILNFNETEKKQLLWVCGVAYGILLLYSFVHYFVIGIEYHNSYKIALPFANGHTLLIAMAFPLWIYLANTCIKNPRQNLYLTLFFVFYTVMIYLSYSRFYWVLATLLILFISMRYHLIRTIITGTIMVIVMYIVYLKVGEYRMKKQAWLNPKDGTSLYIQIESILVMRANESNPERFNRWSVAKLMFSQNLWTGIGINTFPERYSIYLHKIPGEKLAETTRKYDYMNAHSLYIGTMAEQGIFGLLALFFFIGVWVYHWKKLGFLARLIFINYLLLGIIEDFTLLVDIIPCFWLCIAWGSKEIMEKYK